MYLERRNTIIVSYLFIQCILWKVKFHNANFNQSSIQIIYAYLYTV
jgi:hypothetical protein